ncbi:hypothetical protein TGARI_269588 [Toxoplasma gondii ARI]|uniref:Uncharacterized protein n=1 Tax=Toxoplasma gondii ARI TaxID=1074872 RepID=A0A139Y6K7_TOXGO|nr:hypothetical protein TGARI_269588 [Toxoplasma gondii ARI]
MISLRPVCSSRTEGSTQRTRGGACVRSRIHLRSTCDEFKFSESQCGEPGDPLARQETRRGKGCGVKRKQQVLVPLFSDFSSSKQSFSHTPLRHIRVNGPPKQRMEVYLYIYLYLGIQLYRLLYISIHI